MTFRYFVLIVAMSMFIASCGGVDEEGADTTAAPTNTSSNAGNNTTAAPTGDDEPAPSGDGTRILVPGFSGVDVVDLDAESQEPLIEGLGQVFGLELIGDTLWFVEGTDLVAADPGSGDIIGRAPVGDGVPDLAVSGSRAWALTGIAGASPAVAVIDADAMTTIGTIQAPEGTSYLFVAALGDDAWAFGGSLEFASAISKLDADSLTQTTSVDTGILADSLIAGEGAIWVGGTIPSFISESGSPEPGIAKIDPATGDVIKELSLGSVNDHVTLNTGFGYLWATTGLDGTLYKIDPGTLEIIDSIDTGDGAAGIPMEIIFTSDLVWVFNNQEDTVTAFDPNTLEFETGINVPAFSGAPIFAP